MWINEYYLFLCIFCLEITNSNIFHIENKIIYFNSNSDLFIYLLYLWLIIGYLFVVKILVIQLNHLYPFSSFKKYLLNMMIILIQKYINYNKMVKSRCSLQDSLTSLFILALLIIIICICRPKSRTNTSTPIRINISTA